MRPRLVVAAFLVLAAVLVAAGWQAWQQDHGLSWSVVVPLLMLGAAGVALRERGLGPQLGVSVATVVLAGAIPLAGPVGAALVGGLPYLTDLRAKTWRTRLFNFGMVASMGATGGLVYVATGGVVIPDADPGYGDHLREVAVPLLLAYVVMTLLNALGVASMSAAMRGTSVLAVTQQVLRSLGWGYLAHAVIGFLLVMLWGPAELGPVAALFVLGPLVVAHWTIGREAQARREHEETVASFVAALELADPTSSGHSARVAQLAEAIGSSLGVRGQEAEELRYAALLHDIGLVASRVEAPGETVDEATFLTQLSVHPEAGVRVLRSLDFLTGALPAIAHHHERYDGRGYPAGLSGEDIPRAARIIAVADCYDALTAAFGGPGLPPDTALEQVAERAGTHLDPEVVEALRSVVTRSRALARPAVSTPELPRTLPDHDHPEISDAFARWQPEASRRRP